VCGVDSIMRYVQAVGAERAKGRVFKGWRSMRFLNQGMGRNTLSNVGKKIAEWLELSDVHRYTGHCWRRSSATAMADAGATNMDLKRHHQWKSDSVANGYVDNSKCGKIRAAEMLSG